MNATDELIRLYAKQLKVPSFTEYQEILRQADPSSGFADLLLELMKMETASRQENQNRRRLKAAGFPYTKTMEEFDCSQLNEAVSPLFLQELSRCQFIQNRQGGSSIRERSGSLFRGRWWLKNSRAPGSLFH